MKNERLLDPELKPFLTTLPQSELSNRTSPKSLSGISLDWLSLLWFACLRADLKQA